MKIALTIAAIFVVALAGCRREKAISYETVQSFSPARGSVMNGYSGAALDEATRLSEVREQCGTPLAEWQEQIPFFAQVRRLKYKSYDAHGNMLTTGFTFVGSSSDPSLISIEYADTVER